MRIGISRASTVYVASMFVAAMLLVTVAATGCKYHNAHGSQDLPHVVRITSNPSGAKLLLPDRKLSLVTPADVEINLRKSEHLRVEKAGYEPWEGTLGDLPQVARNTFRVDLVPR